MAAKKETMPDDAVQEERKNVVEQLSAVQAKLKAPKVQYNSFGKYKYRSCEDILEAVKPLLAENGLILTLSDEVDQVGERYYIRATATVMNDEGETVSNTALAREPLDKKGMDESQITGTSSSYARKYALNGLFLIDDTKDADTDEYKKQSDKGKKDADLTPHGEGMTNDRLDKLVAEMKRTGSTADGIKKTFGVTDLKDLTEAQYIAAMNRLEKVPDKG